MAELYAVVKGDDEHKELDDFIDLFPILKITTKVARIGGLYKCEYFKSHGVGLADELIAASAEIHNAS